MKHFHKRFTRLTALALSALLLASAPLAVSAQTVEEIEAKQNALAEKKADLESQLAALEEDESDKEAEQALLSEKIDTVRTQISTATENIDTLNDSITALEESLASAEAEIADTMELLKKRLCALYSAGSTVSTLEILFNAESLHDFSMRMEMVSGITRHDKMLIDQVSAYMEETAAQREELEKEKTALADEKKLLESSQTELTELEEENSALLKEIRAEKGETAEQIERTEAEENALANKMAVLIAQMQQQEAANAARPTPTPTPVPEVEPTPTPTPVPEVEPTPTPTPVPETEYDENGNALPTPTPTPVPETKPTPTPTPVPTVKPTPTPTPVPDTSAPSYDSSESFSWPLPGYGHGSITQYFGNNGHKGLDIGAPEGTPIVASRSGTVMIANNYDSWGDSWGYYVSIYHDSTYSTLYAHMSSVAAYEGQWVNKGDVIGYVGSTGNSTGNHLHFEVYQNGTRVDPSQFV